jgi:osmotically inducible lipoprotein OsmB
MKSFTVIAILLIIALTLAGCTGMSRTQQATLSGAAIGAGGGAVLGSIVGGHTLGGAAIGAGLGALGGYLVGETNGGYRHHHH